MKIGFDKTKFKGYFNDAVYTFEIGNVMVVKTVYE